MDPHIAWYERHLAGLPEDGPERIALDEQAGKTSHLLVHNASGPGWQYGERQCFDDTCQCSSHNTWRWQEVTEAEAREIQALFASR